MRKKINLTLEQVQSINDEGMRNDWAEVINLGGTVKIEIYLKDSIYKKSMAPLYEPMARKVCNWWQLWCRL